MAMGAMLPVMDLLETAVIQTVHTHRKVPTSSIKKDAPIGKSGETKLDPNKKGGSVGRCCINEIEHGNC